MKKFLTLTIIAIIALFLIATNVQATETVVEVSTAEQLIQELSNVEANETVTIKLTDNINVTGFVVSKGEKITIDLNGKKIAAQTLFQVNNGTVILKGNGVIETTEDLFYVDTTTSSGNAKVEVGANVKAISGYSGIYIKGKNAEAHVYGSLTATGSYDTIMGNGNITSAGTIINIYSGAEVISENSIGIYHPQDGELNIYGGTITGATAVYHKAGKLNISGGELIATGAKADYVHNPNGCNDTGDALVIEACNYPGGVPEVSIIGGTFISKNNKAIGYYKQSAEYKLANEKFIKGGFFTSDVTEYVAAGYVINPSFEYDFDTYEVKPNRPYVTNDHVTEDDTITGETEIGVVSELQGELETIFEKEIEKNEKLKEALLAGKSVNIHVQMERLEEDKMKAKEIKALKEAAKEGKFVKFYDITLAMIADGTQIDTISEISNKLTFRVLIPEELIKDGRTFFMYRYHDGKVEKLTGELDEENYFIFQADKFSTYALAYEDEKVLGESGEGTTGIGSAPEEDKKDETPATGSVDVVLFASVMVAVISVAGIVTVKKYTR